MIVKSIFLSKRIWIILFLVIILIENVEATGQASDFLIIKKDTLMLYSNPLEPYLEFKNKRTLNGIELKMTSTGCWRGYIATWEIRNDSLFLVKVVREDEFGKFRTFNLKEEFGTSKVFAAWFTGTLYSPRGEMLQYVHMGYSSIYEKEEYYNIWNGQVKSAESKNNLVYDKRLLYPAEGFLKDTLTRIIKLKLSLDILKEIPDSSACFVNVQFSKDGKVEKVKLGMKKDEDTLLGKSILRIAEEEFKKLPPLMTVINKYYQPPYLDLWFHAYCIKNPFDKEYGCSE